MKFLDEVKIQVQAGKGGDGVISFRREFRVDKGGPDGGDGGHGGSIYFVGDTGLNTLFTLKFSKIIKGNNGENGRGKQQYGAKGEEIYIKVPFGTVVREGDTIIADIVNPEPYLIAKGGKGGRGNMKFKTARNTAPRLSENGDPGEQKELELSLKVLADIGFVGKPSAGKSTLLSKISNAKPKVADYEFTTLNPKLGFVHAGENSFVAADLPGLIAGAHLGKGLGIQFLKHIERCKVIAHIIDFGTPEKDPINDYKVINEELESYDKSLMKRSHVIIANKIDSECFDEKMEAFVKEYPNLKIVKVSALKEKGIEPLKMVLYETLKNANELEFEKEKSEITIELDDELIIDNPFAGHFVVSGSEVEKIFNKIPLNSMDNIRRFNKKLKTIGVWDQLEQMGIVNGDSVDIINYEMIWGDEELY